MLKPYDPTVLSEFAQRLLARADRIVVWYVILGALFGMGAWAALSVVMPLILSWLGGAVCVGLGYALGTERAFHLRVQAHTVLCQVAIEMNTRQLVITSQMHATHQVAPPPQTF